MAAASSSHCHAQIASQSARVEQPLPLRREFASWLTLCLPVFTRQLTSELFKLRPAAFQPKPRRPDIKTRLPFFAFRMLDYTTIAQTASACHAFSTSINF